MLKIFKSKLFIVTFTVLLLFSTYCFATDEAVPTSEEPSEPVSDVSAEQPVSEVPTDETTTTESEPEYNYTFISDDIYRSGSDVVISEAVDGNAFAIGNTVTLTGAVNGDFFVIANKLVLEENSYVYGSLLVISPDLVINGNLSDLYAIANTFTLSETGYIARDAKIASTSMIINGVIGRNAHFITNDLSFPNGDQSALIVGNLDYTAPTEVEIPEGVVSGNVDFTLKTDDDEANDVGSIVVSYVNQVLSAVFYSLVVLLLMIWLTPNFIQKSGNIMKKKTPIAFGLGILVFFASIIGSIALLFLTYGLGISVSLAIIALLVMLLSISETIFALAGAKLLAVKLHKEKKLPVVLFALLFVLIINLLKLIPFVGFIVSVVVNLIGLGYIAVNLILKKQDFMTYETVEKEPVDANTAE